jgi:hypothetical protein
LRKGAFYLARIIYLKKQEEIDNQIEKTSGQERKADIARKLIDSISEIVPETFNDAIEVFSKALEDYLKKEGGNEDAALKNSAFATKVDNYAEAAPDE